MAAHNRVWTGPGRNGRPRTVDVLTGHPSWARHRGRAFRRDEELGSTCHATSDHHGTAGILRVRGGLRGTGAWPSGSGGDGKAERPSRVQERPVYDDARTQSARAAAAASVQVAATSADVRVRGDAVHQAGTLRDARSGAPCEPRSPHGEETGPAHEDAGDHAHHRSAAMRIAGHARVVHTADADAACAEDGDRAGDAAPAGCAGRAPSAGYAAGTARASVDADAPVPVARRRALSEA